MQKYKEIVTFAPQKKKNMDFVYRLVKNYPFTTLCILAIWYLSFFTPPHTPLDNVKFIDKWTHIAMYGGTCCVMWAEYLRRHTVFAPKMRFFALVWLAPVAMSGAIELLQEYCTGGRRSGDWFDLAANAVGVTLATVVGLVVARRRAKGRKGV